MGKREVSCGQDRFSDIDKSGHPCYKCLTKACCSRWCPDFFRWIEILQEKMGGVIDEDTLINFVVKYSRNEKWTKKD